MPLLQSKYLLHLLFALLLINCNSLVAQNNFSNRFFPDGWDSNRKLRGSKGKILAWTHTKSNVPLETKRCLLMVVYKDSALKTSFSISDNYNNERSLNEWITNGTYWGPTAPANWGYHELHQKVFDHKPTRKELYELLAHWRFSLVEKGNVTIECGIDEQLWQQTFGFIPNRKFGELTANK